MYDAVLAVIREDRTVKDVAAVVGVSRQTLHAGHARYETEGLEGHEGARRFDGGRWRRDQSG